MSEYRAINDYEDTRPSWLARVVRQVAGAFGHTGRLAYNRWTGEIDNVRNALADLGGDPTSWDDYESDLGFRAYNSRGIYDGEPADTALQQVLQELSPDVRLVAQPDDRGEVLDLREDRSEGEGERRLAHPGVIPSRHQQYQDALRWIAKAYELNGAPSHVQEVLDHFRREYR